MKKVLTIIGVLAGVVAVAMVAVLFFTADMVARVEGFFGAVRSGDYETAHAHLSQEARKGINRIVLEGFLVNNGLDEFEEASWTSRSVSGEIGYIEGTVTTESGTEVPLALQMVKEGGEWKIHSIDKASSGVQGASDPNLPSDQEILALATESMMEFAHSAHDRSMARFHAHLSHLWQEQQSVESLDEAFVGFFEAGDMRGLEQVTPAIQRPTIDENGALVVMGTYPISPNRVDFEQRYIQEDGAWKLVGFAAYIR